MILASGKREILDLQRNGGDRYTWHDSIANCREW